MASREIKFTIIGDATKAQRAFAEAGTSAGKLEGKIEGLGGKFSTFSQTFAGVAGPQVVGAVVSGLQNVQQAAVSLEQNAAKAVTVFGDALGGVEGWASDAAHGMGLTERQAVTLATNMADLLKPMGFTSQQAATMSTETLNLAGALAEWSGGTKTAAEVSEILQAAMLGETDGLKALGISLNAEEIARKAATLTGAEYANMTEAQKEAIATQQLILEKSTDAQIAFANSQGDAASKQAEMTARMNEAKETMTVALAPALNALMLIFAGLVTQMAPVVSFIADNLVPIAGALAVVITSVVVPAFITWATTAGAAAATTALAMAPVIAAVAAVALAVGALLYAWEHNLFGIQEHTQRFVDWFMPIWNSTWGVIQSVIDTVWPIISEVVTTYIGILKKEIEIGIAVVRTVFETVFPIIRSIVETVFPIIADVVTTYIGILRTAIETGVNAAKWAFDNVFVPIQGVVSDVMTTISGIVDTLWNGAGGAVAKISSGIDAAKSTYDTYFVPIQGVVEDVFNTIIGFVTSLWTGAEGAVGLIKGGLSDAKAAFDGVYETFKSFGSDMMQGLIDGVTALYDTFKGWIDKITDLLKIDVPGFSPPYDAGYAQGYSFVSGLADGVGDAAFLVENAVAGATAPMGDVNSGGGGTAPYNPGSGSGGPGAPIQGTGGLPPGADPSAAPYVEPAYQAATPHTQTTFGAGASGGSGRHYMNTGASAGPVVLAPESIAALAAALRQGMYDALAGTA